MTEYFFVKYSKTSQRICYRHYPAAVQCRGNRQNFTVLFPKRRRSRMLPCCSAGATAEMLCRGKRQNFTALFPKRRRPCKPHCYSAGATTEVPCRGNRQNITVILSRSYRIVCRCSTGSTAATLPPKLLPKCH